MECQDDEESAIVDLSSYSLSDSCFWLLRKLNIKEYLSNPYAFPFVSYVLSWDKCVPLTSIVMAQSPYPNDIFPQIAAAMSYDETLCDECPRIKGKVPPTVEILANDLFVHANLDKQVTIDIIKNGWMLTSCGVLLINESVFNSYNSPEGYRESVNQCNMVIRLLRETEKWGKRTVDIYAFGESGQRMASNLCSWFKSPIVKLSKRAVTHPAAISRRFTDFSSPDCHMGNLSFSKNFAKLLNNCVASLHTMSKKQSQQDIKLQRQSEAFKAFLNHLGPWSTGALELRDSAKELRDMDEIKSEKFNQVLDRFIANIDNFAVKAGVGASLVDNAQKMTGQSIAGQVSKSAPALNTVSPNPDSVSNSDNINKVLNPAVKSVVFRNKSKKPTDTTEDSSFDNVTSPPSVTSVSTTSMVTPVVFRKKHIQTPQSIASTQNIESSPAEPTTPISSGTTFANVNLTQKFRELKTSEDPKTSQTSKTSGQKDSPFQLTKEQINNLSCIEGVVELNKADHDTDLEYKEDMETLQYDISQKSALSGTSLQLVEAINEDLKTYENFDFSDWSTASDKKPSKTYEKCRELFRF